MGDPLSLFNKFLSVSSVMVRGVVDLVESSLRPAGILPKFHNADFNKFLLAKRLRIGYFYNLPRTEGCPWFHFVSLSTG